MRKLVVLAFMLALVTLGTVPAARADGQVVATWMLTELHQGGHGGGPLYADGTSGGTLAISTQNGQFRAMFLPVTWSWLVPGSVLYLCSDVRVIQLPRDRPRRPRRSAERSPSRERLSPSMRTATARQKCSCG